MVAEFELDGQKFTALNGGPQFKFTEAISLVVNCESQEEVDYYWEKLSGSGGEEVSPSFEAGLTSLDESQIGFVHKRGRLQRLAGFLVSQVCGRQSPQRSRNASSTLPGSSSPSSLA